MDQTLTAFNTLVTAALLAVASGQYTMNLDQSSGRVRTGETVSVTCEVTSRLNGSVSLAWVRKLDDQEIQVARNGRLTEDFQSTRRYELQDHVMTKPGHHRSTLHIRDAKSSDSGELGCLLIDNNIEILRPVIVQAPVKSVRLSSRDVNNTHAAIYTNDELVELREGEVRRFACSVSGSYPEPRVRILLGSDDLTSTFNRTSTLVKEGPKSNGDRSQFVTELHYSVHLTNNHVTITHEFNRKSLTCQADLPDSDFASASASISVALLGYRPKFECAGEIFAKLYQSNFELRCRVLGEPEVISGRFRWNRKTQGSLGIEAGRVNRSYAGYLASFGGGGNTVKEMTLWIARVYPQHFRSYTFEADNSLGSSTKTIVLRQDPTEDLHSGSVTSFWNWRQNANVIVTSTTFHVIVAAVLTTQRLM